MIFDLDDLYLEYPEFAPQIKKHLLVFQEIYPPKYYDFKYYVDKLDCNFPAFIVRVYSFLDCKCNAYAEIAISIRDGEIYSELFLFGNTKAVDSWRLKN